MLLVSRRNAVGAGLITASLAVLACFGGAAYFARQVVVPRFSRREDLCVRSVHSSDDGQLLIELPATTSTMAPGQYSYWFGQGTGHACLGPVVESIPGRGSVTRVVERVDSGQLERATPGIWSGYVYSEPHQLGLPYRDVAIAVEGGIAPAWRFDPPEAASAHGTWAIHIHGMGGRRAGTLRGIPVARRLGLTSLVVSFRNDGDGPPSCDGRYRLGESEWRDVEEAINYAVAAGAGRIVIFGWSLGAALALQTAALSSHASRITGLVLDAPVFDWRTTLRTNAKAAGFPRPLVRLGFTVLQTKALRWVTGLAEPINLDAMDWLARAAELKQPILVLHGKKDDTTPVEASKQAAALRPDLVSLVEFESVGHSLEWNADPCRWEQSVEDWLHGLASLDPSPAQAAVQS
ncbi:alpha/beta hydrolase family protein [Paenarthrobacter sp. AB444]|uniref:alpha/beta hydrolase family protein n=1 Tax=Paenarthrobacter sp. AB444 TaxID=3025681 RepID=UPI002366A7CA|nr:alpha/beta hydrolase [Paenarthrobacter sp. AB444]MDD7833933.1 alpha/beta hydrolase [Paenarthrobacter sp. AB444]